ncbi:MAG: glycosyltransferase [Sulfuricurvum sp.]|jgi:hypothetical protein
MKHICTYFDKNFLPRGLALFYSIKKHSIDFKFYILSLDDETEKYLLSLNEANIIVINMQQYAIHFSIDKSKYNNEKEFYFSITPAICLYILKKYPDIDLLLYLDADVYLFNDLEILYDEIGSASIAMCSHRLPWYVNIISTNYGIYNVGVNAFRNDKEGKQCLERWFKDCSEWTKDQKDYPLSFFSDQIWLDQWPKMYKNIKIIENIGINTAPWNAVKYNFSKVNGRFYVNDKPLIIYHFSSLKRLDALTWHGNTGFTILNISGKLLEIYKEYIYNINKYELGNVNPITLQFSGGKLKMLVYTILKRIHKHQIIMEKEIV